MTTNPFTDDDLRIMKGFAARLYDAPSPFPDQQHKFADQLKALLARLEAAERIRDLHVGDDPCTCTACIDWRKAAGK